MDVDNPLVSNNYALYIQSKDQEISDLDILLQEHTSMQVSHPVVELHRIQNYNFQ